MLIPSTLQLWRQADLSYTGYRLRNVLRTGSVGSSRPYWTAPSSVRIDHYIIHNNSNDELSRVEEQGSWDNFGSIYANAGNRVVWFVDRHRIVECEHWLIPWHFRGRIVWEVRTDMRVAATPDVRSRILNFLSVDLGAETVRGKEIRTFLAGKQFVEWRDWLAFAMNVGLLVSSTYLFITILRLPWLIRSRLREYRVRKALKAGRCTKCGYDLTGTRAEAGNKTCPECGERNFIDASRPASLEHAHPA